MTPPKPCDCDKCEERESVARVIRDEINYQSRKKSSPPAAYVIVVLRQVLDGIKDGGSAGTPEA